MATLVIVMMALEERLWSHRCREVMAMRGRPFPRPVLGNFTPRPGPFHNGISPWGLIPQWISPVPPQSAGIGPQMGLIGTYHLTYNFDLQLSIFNFWGSFSPSNAPTLTRSPGPIPECGPVSLTCLTQTGESPSPHSENEQEGPRARRNHQRSCGGGGDRATSRGEGARG